jgi:hypothetical protein
MSTKTDTDTLIGKLSQEHATVKLTYAQWAAIVGCLQFAIENTPEDKKRELIQSTHDNISRQIGRPGY